MISLFVIINYLDFSIDMIKLPTHIRVDTKKKAIALSSPAKCIYLSIDSVRVIVATIPETIAIAKNLRSRVIFIVCMCLITVLIYEIKLT